MEPLNIHGGITDRYHFSFEMGTGALDDIDIPQGMSKLGVLGFGFLGSLWHVVGALHGAQDDHLRLRLWSAAEAVCGMSGMWGVSTEVTHTSNTYNDVNKGTTTYSGSMSLPVLGK